MKSHLSVVCAMVSKYAFSVMYICELNVTKIGGGKAELKV